MNKSLTRLTLALLALFMPIVAWAQEEMVDYIPGFVGHPLLKSNGYKAVKGGFDLEVIGSNGLNALDLITDSDPENSATTVNLIGATVGYDDIIKIVPDDTSPVQAQPLPKGKKVGFLVAAAGSNGVNVLDLDLIKMMTINFYDKEGDLIRSAISKKDDNFNALSLSLISFGDGKQKVVAKIPEDISYMEGQLHGKIGEAEVYSISLSTAGLDVNVGHQVKIYYAFIDDFEEVPIIRKYYPRATGEIKGMQWASGNTLVNNNLKDGATLAVINIGGVYCTVKTNEKAPFPQGVEAGWYMTSGTALDLNLGSAMQLIGIDKDGKEVILSTNVNVVGADVIGGGKTAVTFMTPIGIDLYGFKLKRIGVLEANLGAVLINYAYIKVPVDMIPNHSEAFSAGFEVAPYSTVLNGDLDYNPGDGIYKGAQSNPNITNRYRNNIYFSNNEEKPLYVIDRYEEKSKDNPWIDNTYKQNSLSSDAKGVRLVVTRKPIYIDKEGDETVLEWFDIFKTGEKTNYFKTKTYYWGRGNDKNLLGARIWNEFKTQPTDKIDLSILNFTEPDNDYNIYKRGDPDAEDNVVGYEYRLYSVNAKEDEDGKSFAESGVELDYTTVTIPNYLVEWEMAGPVSYIKNDLNHSTVYVGEKNPTKYEFQEFEYFPADNDIVDKYRHYLSWTLPDKIDEKVEVESVDLYKYEVKRILALNTLCREKIATYVREIDPETKKSTWKETNNKEDEFMFQYMYLDDVEGEANDGVTKLVFDIVESDHKNNEKNAIQYGIQTNLKLTDEFVEALVEEFGGTDTDYTNDRRLEYGWYWTGEPKYNMPTLKTKTLMTMAQYDNFKYDIIAEYILKFPNDRYDSDNDLEIAYARDSHLRQLWGKDDANIQNVDILWNQWSTLSNLVLSSIYQSPARYKAGPDDDGKVTFFNVVFNDDNTERTILIDGKSDSDYSMDFNSQTFGSVVTLDKSLVSTDSDALTHYDAVTRAYVPLSPAGFENSDLTNKIQTYLVLETKAEDLQGNDGINIKNETFTSVDGINETNVNYEYFTIDGIKVDKPESGVYIRRSSDGEVRKVIIK